MKISDDSSAPLFRAYQSTEAKLWDQNIVNGKYVISYELDYLLDQDLQNMLPKVYFIKPNAIHQVIRLPITRKYFMC